jgi:hypothetical protein
MMYDTEGKPKKVMVDNFEGKFESGGQKLIHKFQDGSNGLNPNSQKIKLESYGNWEPTTQQKTMTSKVIETVGEVKKLIKK